jgi:tetratricopeptide (TPR) repeat protein
MARITKRALVFLGMCWAAPLGAQRVKLIVNLDSLAAKAHEDSNDAPLQASVALAYALKKKYPEAIAAAHRSVLIDPDFAEGYLAVAYLPFAQQSSLWDQLDRKQPSEEAMPILKESQRAGRRAFILNPLVDLKVILVALPPREAGIQSKLQQQYYNLMVQGFELFYAGSYAEAFAWFDDLLKRWRKEPDAGPVPNWLYWFHGLAAAHYRRYVDAIPDLDTLVLRAEARDTSAAASRLPLSAANDYRYVLGVIYQQAAMMPEAQKAFEEVLDNDLSFFEAHSRLAEMYEGRRQWMDAMTERQRAVAANPEDSGLLYELAVAYGRVGYWEDARKALQQAMALNALDPKLPYLQADVETRLQNTTGARAMYERFLSLAPSRYAAQIADARQQLLQLPAGAP